MDPYLQWLDLLYWADLPPFTPVIHDGEMWLVVAQYAGNVYMLANPDNPYRTTNADRAELSPIIEG